jgi:lysophosphatidate acyltransferase
MSFLVSLVKPLVYISLPVILLRSISSSSQTGRYYVRVGMYLGSLTVAAACGAVIGVALSLAGRRYDVNFAVARCAYAILGIMDVKVEVEGAEKLETRPAVFVCNHQSMVDIVVLAK